MPQSATLLPTSIRVIAWPSTSSVASPFGSSLPSRAWSDVSRGYRYGFNGKEKDSETANDAYDFGARIYDGRLGRWLSLDPLMKKYPEFSTYNFCINNPLFYIDTDGREIIPTKQFLESQLNSIYTNVKTNSMIVEMNSKYNVSLTASNMESSKTAQTLKTSSDKIYTITMNNLSVQNTLNNSLFISTLYHELLHVKITEMYYNLVKNGKYVKGAEKIHPKLYQYLKLYGNYEEKKDDGGKFIQRGWEHNYMADYGRLDLIKAMKEQDMKDNNVDRSGEINGVKFTSDDWYSAQSWGGLDGTESWNKLTDDKKKLYLSLIRSDVDNTIKTATPDINIDNNNSDTTKTGN